MNEIARQRAFPSQHVMTPEPQLRKVSRTPFLLVRFVEDAPVWERFDGHTLHPAQPPGASHALPILALVPDRLFFFFQPESDHHPGSLRQRTAAARLELEQLFPDANPGNRSQILLDPGRKHLLGCFAHPALQDFFRRHQELLTRANAVTTTGFLAWTAGHLEHLQNWIWSSPEEGITAAMHGGHVTFFFGSEAELENRLGSPPPVHSGTTGQPRKMWTLPELLQAAPRAGWSRLRLPLPSAEGEGADLRRLARLWFSVVLIGGLFCLGQFLRLSTHQEQAQRWERATDHLFAEVLTRPLGDDPFGRLLFRRGQLQGPTRSGPDPLAMLGRLSAAAPPDFHVESFSLGQNSGILRARLASYEQLETLIQALDTQEAPQFDLDQASSADEEIVFTLRVRY